MIDIWKVVILVMPAVALGFAIGALLLLLMDWRLLRTAETRRTVVVTLVMILALAIIGGTAGFAGGMSRVGVVGEVYPAILALMGVGAVYLLGADFSKGAVVSVTSLVLAITLFAGYYDGSARRLISEERTALRSICLQALTSEALAANPTAFERFSLYMRPAGPDGKPVDLCLRYASAFALGDPALAPS